MSVDYISSFNARTLRGDYSLPQYLFETFEGHLTGPNRPVRATKSVRSPQWKFEASGTGVNLDHRGVREGSIFNKCCFDIERPRSRSTGYESVHTLVRHRSQFYNKSFLRVTYLRVQNHVLSTLLSVGQNRS